MQTEASVRADDVSSIVRTVVSEKTGYPEDMLDLDMDLEGELGIDSIKQVEILSALRERIPDMPEIDPARLAELRTLVQIAEAIAVPGVQPAPGAAPKAAPAVPAPAQSASSGGDPGAVSVAIRGVVSEKTGYPEDMLDLDMDLEGELGIDSIKQVEILSALRERIPDMPEIDPARLAELRTLAQIAEAIAGPGVQTAPGAAPKAAPAVPAPAQPISSNGNLGAVSDAIRAVVAEKTGYPEDMLDLDMDLEGELGIDSIKQVEILSALRDQIPDMPEIDPARLAELRTLAQIAEAIAGPGVQHVPVAAPAPAPIAAPAPAPTAATPEPAPARPAASGGKLDAVSAAIREVVAEKTGYPEDMLDLDMDLEGELGIDSIKQVEILSALRERIPDMPEIDPSRLAELRTLAQIAEAIAGPGDQPAPLAAPTVAPAVPAPAQSASSGGDPNAVSTAIRAVVAEKTGYPEDMLDLDMDLEGELGIDSIKQVEILSALRERIPDMPEIDPARLAELRTLAQIAEAIAGPGVQPAPAPAPIPAQAPAAVAVTPEPAPATTRRIRR